MTHHKKLEDLIKGLTAEQQKKVLNQSNCKSVEVFVNKFLVANKNIAIAMLKDTGLPKEIKKHFAKEHDAHTKKHAA